MCGDQPPQDTTFFAVLGCRPWGRKPLAESPDICLKWVRSGRVISRISDNRLHAWRTTHASSDGTERIPDVNSISWKWRQAFGSAAEIAEFPACRGERIVESRLVPHIWTRGRSGMTMLETMFVKLLETTFCWHKPVEIAGCE